MPRFLLTVVVVLFSLMWASAQQNDRATPATDPAQPPNANSSINTNDNSTSKHSENSAKSSNADQNSIEGCLRQSSGEYLLESDSGTTYRLKGNTDGLSQYAGKEVRIQGSKGSASDVSTSTSSSSAGSTGTATSNPTAGSEPTIQVSSANLVSDTCQKSKK